MAHGIRIYSEFFSSFVGYLYVFLYSLSLLSSYCVKGGFDSSVHISEEAANAAVAVPWAIVSAIGIAGVLGTGAHYTSLLLSLIVFSNQHLSCILHGH